MLIDVTVKTYPTPPYHSSDAADHDPTADDTFFAQMAYLMSQYPYLTKFSVSAYPYIYPVCPVSATASAAVYQGEFILHDGTS